MESSDSHPISISLPLSGEIFTPDRTKPFFEGLLPEGYSRRAVSDWINTGIGEDSEILYATRRYDRDFTGKGRIGKLEIPRRHRIEGKDT